MGIPIIALYILGLEADIEVRSYISYLPFAYLDWKYSKHHRLSKDPTEATGVHFSGVAL